MKVSLDYSKVSFLYRMDTVYLIIPFYIPNWSRAIIDTKFIA